MLERFSVARCCCAEEQGEYIYSGDYSGLILFDYVITDRHRVQLGTYATVSSIHTALWSGQGAMFGISNVPIARGTPIVSAYVRFTVQTDQSSNPFLCYILADKATHSTPPPVFDIYEINKTDTYVEWPQHGVTWYAGDWIDTPDITAVVQEVVDSANWNPGQTLMIYIAPGNGSRILGGPGGFGELVITY